MKINTEKFNSIVERRRRKRRTIPTARAIERAAKAILTGELIVTTLAHGALITTPSGTYAANGHCNCEAARRGHTQCYHRAAARLMDVYETSPEAISLADRRRRITPREPHRRDRKHLAARSRHTAPRRSP